MRLLEPLLYLKKQMDGRLSVLLNLPEVLPEILPIETVNSAVGIDVGVNKLVALTDNSFIENSRFATNKKTRRQLRIRQRRVNRKVKGSSNRKKAGIQVTKLHKRIKDKRNDYLWKAANKIVGTADAVIREDLNIVGMKSRCKPKKIKKRFMPNGQGAKRSLNRSITDASWGELFAKITWLAAKAGIPVLSVNPKHTSAECSACGHISKANRDGEKFVCEECGHIDHADTQASRTILKRAELQFVSNRRKKPTHQSLVPTCGLRESNALLCNDAALTGKRHQAGNCISKALPEKQILIEPLQLQLFD